MQEFKVWNGFLTAVEINVVDTEKIQPLLGKGKRNFL